MSAEYATASYGGINEQHVGANGAIAQKLPTSVNGTFSLKGGRRRNSKRQSRRRKQRKSRKQQRQRQSKGQKGGK